MTMMERVHASRAALTDRELEVLRLLAAGHTVKSIAAQLGRSEASINERLRDARRKTGFGSSRELARVLASQETWDNFPDLSASPALAEPAQGSGRPGPARSKGQLLMFIAIPVAASALLLATVSTQGSGPAQETQAAAMAPSPLVGRWNLDVSRIPENERPRSVTIEFAEAAGKWTTGVEIVAPDGTVQRAKSTAAADGIGVPITGTMAFIDTASLRHPAANTLVMTLGKDGAPVSTRVYTVARDGRTMTETIIWASGGIPALETTYFNRAG